MLVNSDRLNAKDNHLYEWIYLEYEEVTAFFRKYH